MTDPVTKVEIEDVLSSIRRLVTEDIRTRQQSQPAPAEGRLMLTPALRVADPAPQPAPASRPEPLRLHTPVRVPECRPDEAVAEAKPENAATPPEMSRKLAEIESALARRSPGAEPDSAAREGAEDEPPVSFIRHAAALPKEPAPEVPHLLEAGPGEEGALSLGDGETVRAKAPPLDLSHVDEEALRALVAEIVRQELQGALGERITRNVRKLVRREIQRVISAPEMD